MSHLGWKYHVEGDKHNNDDSSSLTQVQPKHVKEAFRLLNKSIIRVEQPVINFDEEEDEVLGEFLLYYNIVKKMEDSW